MTLPTSPPLFFALAMMGLDADKPTASTVPEMTLYWATDTPAFLLSDGSAWSTIGSGGGGGGGSQGCELLTGNTVTITSTDSVQLTFDTKIGGDDLLDLTTPDTPTVVDAGLYVVTATVYPAGSPNTGSVFDILLLLDPAHDAAQNQQTSTPFNTVGVSNVTVACAGHIEAGGAIELSCFNGDSKTNTYLLANCSVAKVG